MIARPRQLLPRRAVIYLTAITLIAAALRAAALRFPPALTDEAFTFWRVCGSLGQLLDTLRDDSFMPLHYEIVWVLTRLFGTGIWVMRMPSALAAIAMPYAVYRLGRLASGRQAGIYAALLAGSSAFLGMYARNAKMYSLAWTGTTLAIGSLVFFSRARLGSRARRMAWLTFTLFGILATGSHAVVCIPLAMSPVIALFFARRRRLRTTLLALAGTVIVLAGPLLYYTTCNTWFHKAGGLSNRAEDGPAQRDNGLMWIERWQSGRSPQNVLLECLSAYVGGIEWPPDGETFDGASAQSIQHATAAVMIALIIFSIIAIGNALISRRQSKVSIAPLTFLLLLIGIPFYAMYLRSFRTLLAPWNLGFLAWAVLAASCVCLVGGFRARRVGQLRRPAIRIGSWLVISLSLLTLTWAGARYAYAHAPIDATGLPRWNPLWMPRYTGFCAPFICVLIGVVIGATPTLSLRWIALWAVVGLNLYLTVLALRADTETPWPRICDDVVEATRSGRSAVAIDWIHIPRQSFLPSMPAPYYALVTAAGMDVTPPSFRAGQTWPYRPGPDPKNVLSSLTFYPAANVLRSLRNKPVERIVLWRVDGDAQFDPPHLEHWKTAEETTYIVRHIWTWQNLDAYQRIVLVPEQTEP